MDQTENVAAPRSWWKPKELSWQFDHAIVLLLNGIIVVVIVMALVALLTFLLANPGQWFSAEDLVRHAWRSSRFSAEQLRSYVMRVRRRLAPLQLPFTLTSQQGRGYRFDLDGSPQA